MVHDEQMRSAASAAPEAHDFNVWCIVLLVWPYISIVPWLQYASLALLIGHILDRRRIDRRQLGHGLFGKIKFEEAIRGHFGK